METFQIVKIGELICFVGDTRENWKETFEVFKSEGIKIQAKNFSDYSGKSITSDMLLYYMSCPEECPSRITTANYMF